MALLSRKADYAILILSFLHKTQAGGNARLIAEAFQLSRPFVANILKELCQKGFVTSHRGVKGGYAILRPLSQVTLADLLESLDEGFRLTLCNTHVNGQHTGELCTLESNCTVKTPLNSIHQKLYSVLSSTTLADLFHSPAGDSSPPTTVQRLFSLPMSGSCSSTQTSIPSEASSHSS
jgi:Rrf2 family transcriptional regulator, cysteine metabolism repressor